MIVKYTGARIICAVVLYSRRRYIIRPDRGKRKYTKRRTYNCW